MDKEKLWWSANEIWTGKTYMERTGLFFEEVKRLGFTPSYKINVFCYEKDLSTYELHKDIATIYDIERLKDDDIIEKLAGDKDTISWVVIDFEEETNLPKEIQEKVIYLYKNGRKHNIQIYISYEDMEDEFMQQIKNNATIQNLEEM